MARHRAVEEHLIEGQFTLKDVALGQPDLCLQLTRRAHLDMQDQICEPWGGECDLVDASFTNGIVIGIRPVAPLDLRRGVLCEARHELHVRRRHGRVDGRGDHSILKRITAELSGFSIVGGLFHFLNGIGEMQITPDVRRAFREGGTARQPV